MKLTRSQKTYVPSEKDLEKHWYLIDAKGKTLGMLAMKIANLLRGKDKPFFTGERDCGDFVVVTNAREVRLSGPKLDTKIYAWHTRYPAGLRERTAREMIAKKPEKVIFDAVWGMLPRNKLRRHMMKKLKIFAGEEHTHKAQSPIPLS